MILLLPPDVVARLARIEADEGMPPLELVHQAVDVWSRFSAGERAVLVKSAAAWRRR